MNAWNEVLIAFGGNAVLLAVLGFLARSLLQTWLTKDIKTFETNLKNTADSELERLKFELKAKGDISIEQLKSRLQQAALEHEVRFSITSREASQPNRRGVRTPGGRSNGREALHRGRRLHR
jgi:hypothetical protein